MKVHIFGASGSGVTTLGKNLSQHLDVPLFDADDYYWKKTNPPYTIKNSIAERQELLLKDISTQNKWIISGSLDSWSDPFVPLFDAVVFLFVPTEVRLQRLKTRELERFGSRVSTGGDMHQQHQDFLDWAAQYDSGIKTGRSLPRHEIWMKSLRCPIVRLNGELSEKQILQRSMDELRSIV